MEDDSASIMRVTLSAGGAAAGCQAEKLAASESAGVAAMVVGGAGATKGGVAGPCSVRAECVRMKLVNDPSVEAESETPGAEKPLPFGPGE